MSDLKTEKDKIAAGHAIKKSVQIDLEVDTTTTDSSKNPYQGLILWQKQLMLGEFFQDYS